MIGICEVKARREFRREVEERTTLFMFVAKSHTRKNSARRMKTFAR
jgi:hypothetical protein